ncbi:MAG TPA: hypothetical protein VHO84_00160, partial [Syntrophorhabdaceae bacterium]|nr:hypothetical protein [Syntrophorhabdaceae bacterium]
SVMFFLTAGTTFAGCEDDCNGPFQTCLNLCRQTTKEDSPQASACVDRCLHGLSGCQNRCKKSEKSENTTEDKNASYASNLAGKTSTDPVPCSEANAVKPVMVAAKSNPCPGGVYCANGPCEHCCEWGYFYSTPCDCRCYKSSHDASASGCGSYFRCN